QTELRRSDHNSAVWSHAIRGSSGSVQRQDNVGDLIVYGKLHLSLQAVLKRCFRFVWQTVPTGINRMVGLGDYHLIAPFQSNVARAITRSEQRREVHIDFLPFSAIR